MDWLLGALAFVAVVVGGVLFYKKFLSDKPKSGGSGSGSTGGGSGSPDKDPQVK